MSVAREETYSVSQICGEIRGFLSEAFPDVWVSGEVQRLNPSRAGHLYFELVEKGDNDEIVGKLDAVIWRSENRRDSTRFWHAPGTPWPTARRSAVGGESTSTSVVVGCS